MPEGRNIRFKIFRITSAVLLIGWMALIFCFSAQTANDSSETSGNIIAAVLKIFYPGFEELAASAREELVSALQFAARKTAHFSVYAVLGVFSFLSFISYRWLKFSLRVFISAAVCLLYAVSDEVHQLFVPGRSCELRDVLIDFSGALLAVIITALFTRYIKGIYRITKTVRRKPPLKEQSQAYKNKDGCSMNKKQLLEQNTQLFERLAQSQEQIAELKKELAGRDGELLAQKNEIERLNARLNATEPLKALEAKVTRQAAVPPEIEYGASAIGKIVVEAAKYCSRLAARGEQAKELINLVLGRTEVAKAEILKIVSSTDGLEEKKKKADACAYDAFDYFESIMAQCR